MDDKTNRKTRQKTSVKLLDPADSTIQKYITIGKAGKGAYGSVYKVCLSKDPNKFYALKKIISGDEKHDQGFPQTALREIRIQQILDHKNIVKLIKVATSKSKFSPLIFLRVTE